jgi:hypothetical protein
VAWSLPTNPAAPGPGPGSGPCPCKHSVSDICMCMEIFILCLYVYVNIHIILYIHSGLQSAAKRQSCHASPRFDMSIFGPIHLQHWYPNYPNLDIYILDVISNVNIRIDPFATLVPKLPKSIIYIYIHILDITSRIHIHNMDITSRIHIHIWLQADLMWAVWGADAPPGIRT